MEATDERPPRTLARDARRQQLIEATIAVIATRGLARLTLTDVARAAGISHGLVLFHFDSKENLLAETLAYLANEYQRNWEEALQGASPMPADQLAAMIWADFHPSVTTQARLAAWVAFWGETQSRPAYQAICGQRDARQVEKMESLCATLVAEGRYGLDPVHAARILRLVVEGVWLDMVTAEKPYSAQAGKATVTAALALCFPRHFGRPSQAPG